MFREYRIPKINITMDFFFFTKITIMVIETGVKKLDSFTIYCE